MDKRSLLFMICVSAAFLGVNAWFESGRTEERQTILKKEQKEIALKEKPSEPSPLFIDASPIPTGEIFYVLENEYQQLVFSTRGGSLAEINLPMKTSKDSVSIVKEIDIDREILKDSPQNARFPLHAYYTHDKKLHSGGSLGGYYPLLRRALLNKDGHEKSSVLSQYYALNIVGENGDAAQPNYRVIRHEPNLIQFEGTTNGLKIFKTYTIPKEKTGPYCFNLEIKVNGDANGLWLSTGVPDVELVGGSYNPLLRYQYTKGNIYDVETISP